MRSAISWLSPRALPIRRSNRFRLAGSDPSVYLPRDDTKNRRDAELPLRPDTAFELRVILNEKIATQPLLPMPHEADVADMLRHDLAMARTAWLAEATTDDERADRERDPFGAPCDDAGRVLDFHALRATCLSWLAASGAPVKDLQTFARHSKPTLAMNVYTRTLRGSQTRLTAMLQALGDDRPSREAVKMTGTYAIPSNAKLSDVKTGGQTGGKGGAFRCSIVPFGSCEPRHRRK